MISGKPTIRVTWSPTDWEEIRECYVQSFSGYPLYQYMIPDQPKRKEFLRAYLDANYEVTVGSGKGILVGMWIEDVLETDNSVNKQPEKIPKNRQKPIGGLLLVPPSDKGSGWSVDCDDPYWEAYNKHKLGDISSIGLERLKRYEAWENINIAQKASRCQIPMWNGLFCAMLPQYTSQGLATMKSGEAIRIIAQEWINMQGLNQAGKRKHTITQCKTNTSHSKSERDISGTGKQQQVKFLQKVNGLAPKENLHVCSLLSDETLSQNHVRDIHHQNGCHNSVSLQSETIPNTIPTSGPNGSNSLLNQDELLQNEDMPFLVAICHWELSAHFFNCVDFEPILKLCFVDDVEDLHPFDVHILAYDSLRTKRVAKFRSALKGN